MKKYLALTVGLLLSAGLAWGALGDIYASFPAPADYPIAMAKAGNTKYLWVYCNSSPYRIYRIDSNTGSVYESFVSPHGAATRGLTYSFGGGGGLPTGSYLWMGNYQNYHIYRCNYSTGSAYASFPAYSSMINGLAVKATGPAGYRPTHMLSSNRYWDRIYHKDLITGSIKSFFTPPQNVYDLAWDVKNEIIWTGYEKNYVYGYNSSGGIVTVFTVPAAFPLAFAYCYDFLWVGTTTGSHRIWKIHCPLFTDNTNVVPTSVGKIKATYR